MAVLRRVASVVLLALSVPLFGASGAAPAIPSSPAPADAAAPPPPPTALNRLKLMTWNIQDGYDASAADAVAAQVALMVDANADVIGLQEVGVSTGRDLSVIYRDKLQAATGRTWYRVWAPIPMQPNPGGNLVLSTIPIVSSSIRQFDTAPADPSWSGAKRSAAQIELDVNGRRLHIFFTHLDTIRTFAARSSRCCSTGSPPSTRPASSAVTST